MKSYYSYAPEKGKLQLNYEIVTSSIHGGLTLFDVGGVGLL